VEESRDKMMNTMCELKKQDISYFSLNEIRPASENGLLYDSFTPNADETGVQR
jgi:hypothetical protein